LFLCIPNVLDEEQLSVITSILEETVFVDGQATAGRAGVEIKSNLQVPTEAAGYPKLNAIVSQAVRANSMFALAAMPRRIRPIRFARYIPDMYYGRHIDNAVMGSSQPTRIDLAFTLFLTRPETYDGGELVVDEPGTRRKFKLDAGSLVLYSGNSLHGVAKVTRGYRDVAVGWLQSMVRDPKQRRVIFELEELRANILAKSGRTQEFDVISRNVADLWRMWVEV
jgi:PKHD-type hydroxylase